MRAEAEQEGHVFKVGRCTFQDVTSETRRHCCIGSYRKCRVRLRVIKGVLLRKTKIWLKLNFGVGSL